MPPSKKFNHSLKVPLTDFEHYVLQRLQEVTGESMADQVRKAIVVYASQVKELPAGAIALAATSKRFSKKSDADDIRLFQQQADAFERLRHTQPSAARTSSGVEDGPTWSGAVAPIKPVMSGPTTFPEDE